MRLRQDGVDKRRNGLTLTGSVGHADRRWQVSSRGNMDL
jgi:hypothetical protein